MKKIPTESGSAPRLQAEEKTRQNEPPAFEAMSPEEARRALHELWMDKIGLEIQNRELKNNEVKTLHKQQQLEELNRSLQLELSSLRDITERSKAEDALRHQLYFTQTLLDAIPNPVFYKNADGRYLGCNKAYEDFRGITKEDLYGKCVTDVAMPEDAETIAAIDTKLLSGSESHQFETSLLLKNGSRREVIFHKARFNNSKGEAAGLIGVIQEITSLKNAERIINDQNEELEQRILARTKSLAEANEELVVANRELELRRREAEQTQDKLRQLSSAVENSPATIVITDSLGVIEYTNPKFTETTGYQPEEAIGENPRILKEGGQSEDFYRELWTTIRSGREWRGNFCNRKKNGDIYWEHALIYPLRNGQEEITHFVAIKQDITQQKLIAEELIAARDTADAANRSKSEFLANMSHEIRTPLNAIIGFSSLALKDSLPPRQQDFIGKIHTAGELLLNIINDILDFSKIEAGHLEMEQIPFRLNIMMANASSMVQQKARDNGLTVRVETAPEAATYLVGDPHRLVQIIINLLNNAVKFTEQGEVALGAEVLTRENERILLKFTIRDTGIGLSEEQISTLFNPFTQADGSTTRRFGGTGLGLSISKQLAEMMGGEIWCRSEPGQGSTFCFTAWFGIGQANGAERCSPASGTDLGRTGSSYDFSAFRILLVEDNEINRQLAIELLKETGAIVHVAANGQEAVTMICGDGTRYDLVLMDIQMPVMDGYEATRLIRAGDRFAALPIIAMTAHALQEEQLKIEQAGMDACITKPIDAHTMLRVVGFFLRAPEPASSLGERTEESGIDEAVIPEITGLDIAAALERLGGDRLLYLWVLRTFVESQSLATADIKEALRVEDAPLAKRLVHTAKGVAGSVGAVALEELALALEKAISTGGAPSLVSGALDCFAAELSRLVTELKQHLPAEPQSDDSP